MALPIWAIYMKMCYADEALNISKDDFTEPDVLTIETDCERYRNSGTVQPEIPDEFDF